MKRSTLNKDLILETYDLNIDKGKYWVAYHLNLNPSSVSSLIDKYRNNSQNLDKDLETQIEQAIKLYPYTGTKHRISKYLNITVHELNQVLLKTNIDSIKIHFSTPKSSTHKLSDNDIKIILEESKKGTGHDKMGEMLNIDGVCIRNIRKKFLSSEEYEEYHSINRFYEGDYNSYYNNRGDKFLSRLEEKVADFLYNLDIKYFSNVRIHYKNKNYSPDIYLPKTRTFIEIFGMSNVEYYKKRMEEKIKYYKDNNIKCLYLFEEDFKKDEGYQNKITNFIKEINNNVYNNHIKKIYINKSKK